MSSHLDQQQILQALYDEASNRLRVDAELTASIIAPPGLEVAISDIDDSIKIGNGSGTYAQVTGSNALKVDNSAVTQPISATSLPLPSGASTSALQLTGNTSLSSIDSKLTSPLAVSQSGIWTTGRTWNLLNTTDSVNIGNFPATQAVTQSTSPWVISGAVIANAGTNLNTSALALDSTISSLNSKVVTADTSNVTVISSVLPSGASTSALQTTGNTSLSSIDGKLNSLGQKTMANSTPVTIASDQSAISVSQYYRLSEIRSRSFVCQNIQNTTGVIYTVTGGKTFYLTSIGISALDSSATAAQLVIRDGATSPGDKLVYLWQAEPTLGTPQPFATYGTFENNPIPFTTTVNAVEIAGTIAASIYIIGYEE